MAASVRTRLFALLSLFLLAVQFPLVVVRVPMEKRVSTRGKGQMYTSILQIAASHYKQQGSMNEGVLKAVLAPGLLAYDLKNMYTCKVSKREAACNLQPALPRLDGVFEMSKPMYRPDVVMAAVENTFGDQVVLIQMGCTLTAAAALISLVMPAKIGFFAYGMLLYGIFKSGATPLMPAYAFLFVFSVATDVLSFFSGPPRTHRAQVPQVTEHEKSQ